MLYSHTPVIISEEGSLTPVSNTEEQAQDELPAELSKQISTAVVA